MKSEIERELNTDEIKRQLHNEAILDEMRSLESDVNTIGNNFPDETIDNEDPNPGELETAVSGLQKGVSRSQNEPIADARFEEGEEPRDLDSEDFEFSNEPHPNDNRGN